MAWRIELTASARKTLEKLDPQVQRRITGYLRERVSAAPDPRTFAKSLQGDLRQYWRFRIGPYRIVCDIEDEKLRVLVIRIAHRKVVYRRR